MNCPDKPMVVVMLPVFHQGGPSLAIWGEVLPLLAFVRNAQALACVGVGIALAPVAVVTFVHSSLFLAAFVDRMQPYNSAVTDYMQLKYGSFERG